MRSRGTNDEVIAAYFAGDSGPYTSGNGNIYFEGRTLYSYGRHFPLAYHTRQGVYLLNGDRYSVTTAGHQSGTRTGARGKNNFTLSFGALEMARINFREVVVIDYTKDQSGYGERGEGISDPASIPENATVHRMDGVITDWHLAASAVLEYAGKHYVAGMDEQSYFISELPGKVGTVDAAFQMLKPERIWEVQVEGIEVKRQGEWFCFPVIVDTKAARTTYKQMKQGFDFPGDGNTHTATRGAFASEIAFWKKYPLQGNDILFSGSIRHPEHRTLRVSKAVKPEIWQAVRNTAVASWSVGGVD